jgi:hypothetical protein
VWEGFANRRHNRLSVRPKLIFQIILVPGEQIRVSFENQALGPAILRKFELVVDENRRFALHDHSGCKRGFSAAGFGNQKFFGLSIDPGSCFAPGESHKLIEFSNTNRESYETILRGLTRIKLSIVYESMYGESVESTETLNPEGKWGG